MTSLSSARRRFERDLHDGAQQRLVSLGLELRTAKACVPPGLQPLKEQISGIVHGLAGVSDDLREISHGIHPAILSKGGLGPALKQLARRSAVPVELDLGVHNARPSPPKWPRITLLPKPSPTSPSTHKRPRSQCASKPTMPTSVFPFRTTESGEPMSVKVPD
jgi:hypothetical protein